MARLMNEEHKFLYKYNNIPDTVTISSYTTAMEQLRLSSDNMTKVMVNTILPQVVDPEIDIRELYEPDYQLMLRHLRILTWGPFFTPHAYYCENCINDEGAKGKLILSEKQINLGEIPVIRPENDGELKTEVTIKHDEFIFLDADVKLHLRRCKDLLLQETKMPDERKKLIPLASSISSVTDMEFVTISEVIDWLCDLAPADFEIIQETYNNTFTVGLASRVECTCEYCGGKAWSFVQINDNYFRPTRADLKEWKNLLGNKKSKV